MELKGSKELKLYKIYDEPSVYIYIVTTMDDKCYSDASYSLRMCLKTIGNPSNYFRNSTIQSVYSNVKFKELLCTFKSPDELINLIPEEFL